MEGVRILSISDLLQRCRPLTGAASIQTSPSISRDNPRPPPISHFRDISPENARKTLRPFESPAILIGAVRLPSPAAPSCASKRSCLSFSDGSSAICCAVLDKKFNAVGKQIRVLAWNFIPSRPGCSGLLEIIRWEPLEPTSEIGGIFPLVSSPSFSLLNRQSSRSRVVGRLDSVSSIFSVPCTVQTRNVDAVLVRGSSGSKNMVGFLSAISVCECPVCSKGGCADGEGKLHSFTKRVLVYFIGSAVGWHPLLCKLLGYGVSVVGVQKKLISVGGDESCLAFITTEKAALYLSQLHLHSEAMPLPVERKMISGKSELGNYTGIVTGIFFQGMAIELDGKVWLLVSGGLIAPPVRVGALISLSNVHFIRPKFSWVQMLLLGTCFKTSINVNSFSPFQTQCNSRSQEQSLLMKFIESLRFSARFWVLLTISCFSKKFSGVLSEKEILGTKHNEGLLQKYASLCLPSCAFQPQYGLFLEFARHDFDSCCKEPDLAPLKLAVPISNFISKCEVLWSTLHSKMRRDAESVGPSSHASHLSCEGRTYRRMIRQIISSEDLGIVLVGTLKISQNSGRLQLVDATGRIDVIVPDLISNADVGNVYEVRDYTVCLEGFPSWSDSCQVPKDAPFSCKSIFSNLSHRKELNQLAVFVQFYLSNTASLNAPLCLPLCKSHADDFKANRGSAFHVLLVTHKFPTSCNFPVDPEISNRSSSFAEAIIIPHDLFLSCDGDNKLTSNHRNQLKSQLGSTHKKNCVDLKQFKRQRTAHGSNGVFPYSSMEIFGGSELDISCSVAARSINDKSPVPGILSCLNKKCYPVDGLNGQKVLLEFMPESFNEYQLLQIGIYYIMKCSKDNVHGKALVITSQTPLWSLSFTSDGIMQKNVAPQDHWLQVPPVRSNKVSFRKSSTENDEVMFESSSGGKFDSLTDLRLYLSIDSNYLLEARKALENQLFRSIASLGEAVGVSSCAQHMMEALRHPLGAPDHRCPLPEGNLISLRGDIADLHSLHHNSVNSKQYSNFGIINYIHQKVQSSICIHVHEGCHMVRIHGTICSLAYPVGMGPGANATFHRVLMPDSSIRQCELMLTPVSFIVVNSVKNVVQHDNDGFFLQPPNSDILNAYHPDLVSSKLLSQLIQYSDNTEPIRLHCRVVAVLILVLEKDVKFFQRPGSDEQSKTTAVSVVLAGFVLDDGSSSCCCWANGDRAAMLLRLHEKNGSHEKCEKAQRNRSKTSTHDLEKMLIKHNRIVVKNCGTRLDSSFPDFIFSTGSNQAICWSEEKLLRSIIMKSCHGSVLCVLGSVMHPNIMGHLEMQTLEMHHHALNSMQNLWAREVGFMDPLAAARTAFLLLVT